MARQYGACSLVEQNNSENGRLKRQEKGEDRPEEEIKKQKTISEQPELVEQNEDDMVVEVQEAILDSMKYGDFGEVAEPDQPPKTS